MPSLRSAARGVASATAARIASAALSVLLLAFMARRWSAGEVGTYATVLGFFELLQQVPLLGLHQRLAREISLDAAATASVASATAAIEVGASLLIGLLLGVIGSRSYPATNQAFWLAGASLVPTAIIETSQAVLIGQQRLGAIARVTFLEAASRTGLIAACIRLDTGLTAVFAAFFCCRCLAAALHLGWSGTARVIGPSRLDGASLLVNLRDTRAFFPILLLSALNNRVAIVILSLLSTPRDVGFYSSAAKLYEILLFVPNVVLWSLYPLLARTFASDRAYLARLVHDLVAVGLLVGLPCAIAISFFADGVTAIVLGVKFRAAGGVFRLLVIAAVFFVIDKALAALLVAARRQDLDLKVLAVSSTIYTTLLIVLVHFHGYLGAAIATLSAMVVQFALRLAATQRVLDLPVAVMRFPIILCAAAVMEGIVHGLAAFSGWIALPVAIVIYVIMIIPVAAGSLLRSL